MSHGSTLNIPYSSTPPLYHLYITSSPPTQTPEWTLQSQNHRYTSRQAILQYTYWLTKRHNSNIRDVPLIEGSIEDCSLRKHYRKKKKVDYIQVNAKEKKAEEPWSKYCDSPKKVNVLQITYTSLPTQPPK